MASLPRPQWMKNLILLSLCSPSILASSVAVACRALVTDLCQPHLGSVTVRVEVIPLSSVGLVM